MINYTEKGQGQHDAIRAAGEWLREENGEWVCSDEARVQAVMDAYTIDKAQALRCAEVDRYAKALRDKALVDTSPYEAASWPIKLDEAQKYSVSGVDADARNLLAEATDRGIALPALVARVLLNAQALAGLEAAIAGTAGRHRDAIKALPDFAGVLAYDFSTGWPV